jgi:hypothetical protein
MSRANYQVLTDGFNFTNSWLLDDSEKQQLHDLFAATLPLVEAIASPIIAAIAGPVLALELGLAGPFFSNRPRVRG